MSSTSSFVSSWPANAQEIEARVQQALWESFRFEDIEPEYGCLASYLDSPRAAPPGSLRAELCGEAREWLGRLRGVTESLLSIRRRNAEVYGSYATVDRVFEYDEEIKQACWYVKDALQNIRLSLDVMCKGYPEQDIEPADADEVRWEMRCSERIFSCVIGLEENKALCRE